jgi:hypothetical protein
VTARIRALLRRDWALAAARVAYVEQDGDRWAAFDVDDRRVAWGTTKGRAVVLHGVD